MLIPSLHVRHQAAAVCLCIAVAPFSCCTSYDHISPIIGLLHGPTRQVIRKDLAVLIPWRASLNREGERPALNSCDVGDQHIPHADDASSLLFLRTQVVNKLLLLG